MAKEKLESKGSLPLRRTFRNTMLATALGATLLTGTTGCNSNNEGNDKNQEKIELTDNANTGTDGNTVQLEEAVNQGRKIVSEETYYEVSEETGDKIPVIKKIYEDGSWSIEQRERNEYTNYTEYTEYYPNSNKIKFIYSSYNHKIGDRYRENAGKTYIIYDENGKILYEDRFDVMGGSDNSYRFDEKDRVTHYEGGNATYDLQYDDKEGTVTCTARLSKTSKIVTVYKQEDPNLIISQVFTGEAGKKIDVKNGGLEDLIKEMGLEDVPYIHHEPTSYYIY